MTPLVLTLWVFLTADDSIPPEKAAQITHAQQKAQAEVNAKYGNRKPSELSGDERKAMIAEQAAADRAVLEKAGVDPKTWARESIKRDRAAMNDQKQRVKDLEARDKKAEAEKGKDGKAAQEVSVQRGFNDDEPVTLDEQPNADGTVTVEKQLPPEAAAEQSAASEQDRLEGSGSGEDPAPAKPAAKGGGRKR